MAGYARLPTFFFWGKFQAAWTPPATMNFGQKTLLSGSFWDNFII
jgi:hypothetical protein